MLILLVEISRPILFRKYVFVLRNVEKETSDVTVVTGKVAKTVNRHFIIFQLKSLDI